MYVYIYILYIYEYIYIYIERYMCPRVHIRLSYYIVPYYSCWELWIIIGF